jgi:asparagine synthase (glutamine-hydrolysing)
MPEGLKRRGGTGKAILRETFANRLGRTLTGRKKKGFDLPMGKWLRGSMHREVEERLRTGLRSMPWIDRGAVEEISGIHVSGRVDLWRQVWLLVALAAWFDLAGKTAAKAGLSR